MIQRIQSLYLLLIVILSSVTLFAPVAEMVSSVGAGTAYILDFKGISQVKSTGNVVVESLWALTTISAIIPIVALVTVFMFKKRILQIRLCVFNMVIMAGYYGMLFLHLWLASAKYHADWHLSYPVIFPLVCIILDILAIRGIGKDEALIKSLNRIR
ncbi:MAG: DUF4293 domain-containing protein [Paludibacter sp.]|nr:DUF4293 domain-containing protein [Paludibacter sp.]